MMWRIALMVCVLLLGGGLSPVSARDIIRVGGYSFPPFVEADSAGVQGLTLDLIALLNQSQDKVEFQFVPTSARRRYNELMDGKFDAIFFEDPEWEWTAKALPVEFSKVFLTGGELYITQAQAGRGQDYFNTLAQKTLVAMLGYHYGFADFQADPDQLKRKFAITLVSDNRSCIEMALAGRAEVAVVTDAYLWRYLSQNPAARDRLLVSERKDQTYSHRILLKRGNGKLDVATLNQWLDGLERDGRLAALWKKAGITR